MTLALWFVCTKLYETNQCVDFFSATSLDTIKIVGLIMIYLINGIDKLNTSLLSKIKTLVISEEKIFAYVC